MNQARVSNKEIETLLQWGLDYYGRGQVKEAVACWRRVLTLAPDHAQALDYLSSAGEQEMGATSERVGVGTARSAGVTLGRNEGVESAPLTERGRDAQPPVVQAAIEAQLTGSHPFDANLILDLVRRRRFEEALIELYGARDRFPSDAAISRSIAIVREKIAESALARIGRLDRVPRRADDLPPGARPAAEEAYVLQRIDGICTFDDLLSVSNLGRHRTLRAFAWLIENRFIVVDPIATPLPPPATTERRTPIPSAETPEDTEPQAVRFESRRPFEPRTTLPAPAPPADDRPTPVRAPPSRQVLVVDSNTTTASLTRTLVRVCLGKDAAYATVTSGPAAVEAAVQKRPDLVITEFMVPGFDGVETVRKIRQELGSVVPAVITVQKIEQEFVRQRLPERAAMVVRPYDRAALEGALRALLPSA